MSYIVRANGFEIECATVEEVRALVGVPMPDSEGKPRAPQVTSNGTVATAQQGGRSEATPRSASDHALLKALVDKGNSGIDSTTALGLLSARGRGVPGAFTQWAHRVGLPESAAEPIRVGNGRGWRLTAGALAAARVILDGGAP